MIEQGKLTISEVAYDVGFKDIAYFRKCFKAQIGINPSEVPVKKEDNGWKAKETIRDT